METSFDKLGLNQNLVEGLKKEKIYEPTAIQEAAIPPALENRDIIGQSITGSGKTLAYLLPIFQRIQSDKREAQAIILAPTHELAMQIYSVANILAKNSGLPIRSASIIGRVKIDRQIEKLKEKPHIIVGSPGRILELIKMRKIGAHTVKTIVIDEADRLLDDNNISQVKNVIKTTLRDRQLMMFSATINEATVDIAKAMMKEPEVIKIEEELMNPNIDHMYIEADQRDKVETLRKLIASIKPEKAIVFLNKNEEIQEVTFKLQYHNIKAYGIYGNASKEERKKALEDFRSGKLQLLIASDIASRGLDIKDITHIFNLDLPENLKEYLHRAGRTGRTGNLGTTISIVNEKEVPLIKKIEKTYNIKIKSKSLYGGRLQDR
ncbi:MAG: DEAD/DEAH box helicase [Lutispora sp.]|nr:DEAD/DEAH box helicase [Lutispora sp.]